MRDLPMYRYSPSVWESIEKELERYEKLDVIEECTIRPLFEEVSPGDANDSKRPVRFGQETNSTISVNSSHAIRVPPAEDHQLTANINPAQFNRERVQFIIDRYLNSFLEDHKYNPRRAKRLAENLSAELRDMVKRCSFERYRVVAMVTVGDKNSQDFKSFMRFVWDAEKDGYVNFVYEAPTYFVIATVLAVYYE
ncbi:dynein light chain Tctex-type protein 2B-like [Ochlerotatus camptorhynchus]|uniref:dynein light chain Tctex-type protein 2B-like n=1 Tax=Ochlerotatus camptorhynchus TaxID=644619 RepID=UPI0031DAB861